MVTFAIILGILIFVIIILLIVLRKKKIPNIQTQAPTTGTTTTGVTPQPTINANPKKLLSTLWNIIVICLVIIALFFAIRVVLWGVGGIMSFFTPTPSATWKIEKVLTVHYNGEYGSVIQVKPGSDVSFRNSTQPYCAKNKSNVFCGEKGEDLMKKMGYSKDNGELQFKSQSQESGSIEIVFWKKQ